MKANFNDFELKTPVTRLSTSYKITNYPNIQDKSIDKAFFETK